MRLCGILVAGEVGIRGVKIAWEKGVRVVYKWGRGGGNRGGGGAVKGTD